MSNRRKEVRAPAVRRKAPEVEELTLGERIALAIADQIVRGEYPPGSHLNEISLADQFQVSRTPVREAIRQLVAMELVEIRPNRGAFVSRIPIKRLLQMFEFMAEMEAICARLAARRMSQEEKLNLKKIHDLHKRKSDKNDDISYFYKFHQMIFAGSKNEPLEKAATNLYNRLVPYRKNHVLMGDRANVSFSEHDEVLQAILSGDGEAAEAAMRKHTGSVIVNIMDMVASFEEG